MIYPFIDSQSSLFIGNQETVLAQMKACKRLLNQTKKEEEEEENEAIVLNKEIYKLKRLLNLIQYRYNHLKK